MFSFRPALLLLLCLCALPLALQAQILDDSTKQVYGTRTTRFFSEQDILNGKYSYHAPDTGLYNFHNERTWFGDSAFYQFLDNFGSAAQPLFWREPQVLGIRPGKTAFDLYAYNQPGQRYLDTRSPFSTIRYINGYKGFQKLEASLSRNIKPWWNAGFDYSRLATDRQIALTGRQDETQISSNAFALHTSLRTPDSKYRLLANFTLIKHRTAENGGAATTSRDFRDSLIVFRTEPSRLTGAENLDQRLGYHLYQQYQIFGENLKLFHVLDQYKQLNRFSDTNLSYGDSLNGLPTLAFYPLQLPGRIDTAFHRTTYRQLENRVGIKGNRNNIAYTGFVRRRDARAVGWFAEEEKFTQHFAGGDLRLSPLDSLHLTGFAEKQLDGPDYRFRAGGAYRWLQFSQERISLQPSLTELHYRSDLFNWTNDFENTVYDISTARLRVPLQSIRTGLQAEVKYISHKNLVYFNEVARPAQNGESGNALIATLRTFNKFGSFRFNNRLTYTTESSPQLIRMPELFYQGQLYFEGPIFKNALLGQIGFEARTWSSYFPDTWMPATQQFHLQNELSTRPYPLVDFFINADIQTVTVYLKVVNVAYGLTNYNYFQTPYYPGLRRSFALGFRWMFFD